MEDHGPSSGFVSQRNALMDTMEEFLRRGADHRKYQDLLDANHKVVFCPTSKKG